MRSSARSPTPATSLGRARRAECACGSSARGRARPRPIRSGTRDQFAVAVARGDVGERRPGAGCRADAASCGGARSCLRRRVRAASRLSAARSAFFRPKARAISRVPTLPGCLADEGEQVVFGGEGGFGNGAFHKSNHASKSQHRSSSRNVMHGRSQACADCDTVSAQPGICRSWLAAHGFFATARRARAGLTAHLSALAQPLRAVLCAAAWRPSVCAQLSASARLRCGAAFSPRRRAACAPRFLPPRAPGVQQGDGLLERDRFRRRGRTAAWR